MNTSLANRLPDTNGMHRHELQGRAAGIMVGAIFGLAWLASTLSLLSTAVAIPVLAPA
jgi:hypothetical protein